MKKKLNLNSLKVKSFVTDFDKENAETVKGGASVAGPGGCSGTPPNWTAVLCGGSGVSCGGWTCEAPCISATEPPDTLEQCSNPLVCN